MNQAKSIVFSLFLALNCHAIWAQSVTNTYALVAGWGNAAVNLYRVRDDGATWSFLRTVRTPGDGKTTHVADAVCKDGIVYVADMIGEDPTSVRYIRKYSIKGGYLGDLVRLGDRKEVGCLCLSSDGESLYAGYTFRDAAGTIDKISLADGTVTQLASGCGTIRQIAVDGKGHLFAGNRGGAMSIVSEATGEILTTVAGDVSGSQGVAYDPVNDCCWWSVMKTTRYGTFSFAEPAVVTMGLTRTDGTWGDHCFALATLDGVPYFGSFSDKCIHRRNTDGTCSKVKDESGADITYPASICGLTFIREETPFGVKPLVPGHDYPEAIAEAVRGDGNGYIATGYSLRGGLGTHTTRMDVSWNDKDCDYGRGVAPGPTCTSTTPGVLGFWDTRAGSRLFARYNFSGNSPVLTVAPTDAATSFNLTPGDQRLRINVDECRFDFTSNGSSSSWTASAGQINDNHEIALFGLCGSNAESYFDKGTVMDFKRYRVWEADSESETLVRDFVPCLKNGKAAIYDMVNGNVVFPIADTNGFAVIGAKSWRVKADGMCSYVEAGDEVALTLGGDAVAYTVRRDADAVIIARGEGVSVSFTMPATPVTVHPCVDAAVADGQTLLLGETAYYHSLSFGTGAHLALTNGAAAVVEGALGLPSEGKLTIDLLGVNGCGVYTVMEGLPAATAIDSFVVGTIPSGYVGAFEKWNDRLVVRVTYDMEGDSLIFVKSLQTDAVGWIDTEYRYDRSAFPNTSRIRLEGHTDNYGRPDATASHRALFGTWGTGEQILARWDNQSPANMQVWSNLREGTGKVSGRHDYTMDTHAVPADFVLEFDFLSKELWATFNGGARTTFGDAELDPLGNRFSRSFWLFGCNGNNNQSYMRFRSFRVWETPNGTDEVLAVDMVPCVSAGKVAVYDRVRERLFLPTCAEGDTTEFSVAEWGVDFAQQFARVKAESAAPVRTAEFGPQNVLAFTADGTVTPTRPVMKLTVAFYDGVGAVIGEPVDYAPAVGEPVVILLGTAKKAVVTVAGGEDIVQDFGPVRVASSAEALYRHFDSRGAQSVAHEIMLAANSTVTFAVDGGRAEITRYAADGSEISATPLADRISASEEIQVVLGDGVAYAILRVCNPRKGFGLFIR